jgi:NADPH:quinone reductase
MRAARIHTFGEPLQIDEIDTPATGDGEVLVRLTHAGVNPLDLRVASGGAGRMNLPFIPGCDGVGATDQGMVVVYGGGIGLSRSGTYAEAISVRQSNTVAVPDGVDAVQAAGVGLAGVTAWGVVHDTAGVTSDDRVLVLGASGGVGSLAVQVVREAGARVWSQVAREDDVALQQDLGAEQTIVGDAEGLRDLVRDLKPTVIVDPLGGAYTAAGVRAIDLAGRIVVVGVTTGATGEIDLATLYRKGGSIRGHAALTMTGGAVREALEGCLRLMAEGRLRVHVDSVLPLDQVNEAHARLKHRRATGKLVLSLGA